MVVMFVWTMRCNTAIAQQFRHFPNYGSSTYLVEVPLRAECNESSIQQNVRPQTSSSPTYSLFYGQNVMSPQYDKTSGPKHPRLLPTPSMLGIILHIPHLVAQACIYSTKIKICYRAPNPVQNRACWTLLCQNKLQQKWSSSWLHRT